VEVQFFQTLHQPVAVVAEEDHLPQILLANLVDPAEAAEEKD
jgi:hypothetical protein